MVCFLNTFSNSCFWYVLPLTGCFIAIGFNFTGQDYVTTAVVYRNLTGVISVSTEENRNKYVLDPKTNRKSMIGINSINMPGETGQKDDEMSHIA